MLSCPGMSLLYKDYFLWIFISFYMKSEYDVRAVCLKYSQVDIICVCCFSYDINLGKNETAYFQKSTQLVVGRR